MDLGINIADDLEQLKNNLNKFKNSKENNCCAHRITRTNLIYPSCDRKAKNRKAIFKENWTSSHLKVSKREIFVTKLFTLSDPI
jgi:hypothetical protein